ncbi:TonB-dependent receptor [Pedobacter chitinilyticus]|uniref:TonB-dependent receptor n=1 Tax=Pedobacter chitinilyticus TaxID=2233776 RepID=A0A443YUM9_9SPHI|nr:TonB-dependent receptor [Pedobacter chitinilyticus]RWU07532.1 TonB-dependent receptor [Pedobacter chitinilyticus]
MTSKIFKLLVPLLFISFLSFAQQTFKISGRVKSSDGAIEAATIQIVEEKRNIMTDSLGYYEVELKAGSYTFLISAVGMNSLRKSLKVNKNHTVDFALEDSANNLDEIVISTTRDDRSLASPQMGAERLTMKAIKNIPLIFGERDVMKAIQLLPGIKSAGEGGAGIYVRGGSADQNLVLMDDVPVYNAAHLLGFFSTFNPDAVEDITVYKTGMPSQYGGRLSSVLDIKMRQGDAEKFSASGGIGLISSKLTLEGPIKKEKSSFLVSARRTYVDALLKLSPDSTINQNTMYFYDVNGRADFQLGENDKLTFSGYLGSDKLGIAKTFGLSWGNAIASAQWKHLYSSKLNSTTTASYTRYQNKIEINTGIDNVQIYSQLNDWALKHNFFWQASDKNLVKFGFNSIYHKVTPGEISSEGPSSYNPVNYQQRFSLENAVFASSDWQATEKLNIGFGVRLTGFSVLGGGDFLTVDPNGNVTNSTYYKKGEVVKTYLNLEPRLSLSYLLNAQSSVKASYVRNAQNMHMISNSTSSRPSDKWLPSSLMVKPEVSDQFAVGYYRNLFDNAFELNVESYYKTMDNQIDYRDGAETFNSDNIETQLLYGIGRAYGLEVLFKKKKGDFTGWLSYTLSKTERQIDGINGGKWYNARQDRTHEVALVGSYQLNKRWSLSASWIYYTGDAITFPTGKYNMDGQVFFYYTDRNTYRMPSYHRLDLGANLQLKKRKNFSSELSFSLYNAYGRKNAYMINFREAENDPSRTEVVRTTLFQFLPSVSYNFKF